MYSRTDGPDGRTLFGRTRPDTSSRSPVRSYCPSMHLGTFIFNVYANVNKMHWSLEMWLYTFCDFPKGCFRMTKLGIICPTLLVPLRSSRIGILTFSFYNEKYCKMFRLGIANSFSKQILVLVVVYR